MKNALIVTYVWPPFGHAPVQRVLRFAKYLPQFGWHPVILTVANPTAQMQTGETGEGIADQLEVYRAPTIEPPYALKAKVRDWLRTRNAPVTPPAGAAASVPLHARVQFLDTQVGWVPLATLRGLPLVRAKRIEAIFVSAPPFSSLLIGRALAKLTGRPWVPDFRDEWCGFLSFGYESGGRNRFAERIESQVVTSAARVVSVSAGITDNFRRRYSQLDPAKFVTINNGYDPDDFPPALTAPRRDGNAKLRITFIGTIVRLTTARYFLNALAELAAVDPRLSTKVEVHFYGRIATEERAFFDLPALRDLVTVHGYVPHQDCPRVLCESDVLLVLLDEVAGAERVPTAKIFEYLAAHRFILAAVPEGETATFVRQGRAGAVVNPRDTAGLCQTVSALAADPAAACRQPAMTEDFLQGFSRKQQTKQLAAILDQAVARAGRLDRTS